MPVQGSHVRSYIGQLYQAVVNNPQWFAGKPTIVCGDFNSNKFWDHVRKINNHSAVVKALEKRRLASAYHHFFSESQGQETQPTYYFWHHKDRGYHIDYVFLPQQWAAQIKTVELSPSTSTSPLPRLASFRVSFRAQWDTAFTFYLIFQRAGWACGGVASGMPHPLRFSNPMVATTSLAPWVPSGRWRYQICSRIMPKYS